jgi:hypothetical protein
MNMKWKSDSMPFAAAMLSAAGAAAEPLVLADGGRSGYRILLAADAIPAERQAAEEFQRFFREMSGADLPIGTEADPPADREICLNARGRIASIDPELAKAVSGRDGFAMRTAGGRLLVAGDRPRGTLAAVYTLLEEPFGCRWFTREVSRIPKRDRWELGPIDVAYAPPLEYREVFWTEAFDPDWAARHRLNGRNHRLDERRGGGIGFHPFVHSFDAILPPATHFAEHPEYYSEIDGKRLGERAQLCLTNPEVLRLAIERVKGWIEAHPGATLYSVSQNDWRNNCRCAGCRALDEREESPAGSLLAFVNAVAEAVEAEHPDKLIETLAYQYTRKPPKTLRPRANVRVRLCSIECCFAHPLNDPGCPENRSFRADLEGWAAITDRLYIWDYTTDFSHYILPFPNFDVLGPNVRFFVDHGVKGLFEQGNYSKGGGGELSELRAYVLAKLLWNPRADAAKAVEEFTDAVYGKAGPRVREYLAMLHERVRSRDRHLVIWSGPDAPFLGGDFLDRAEALFDRGAGEEPDPAARARLRKARLPLDYLRLVRTPVDDPGRGARLDAFVADCREFGITNVSEGRTVEEFGKASSR